MLDLLFNNLDLLWVPVAALVVHKKQRLKAVLYCLACYVGLRLQLEMMFALDLEQGFDFIPLSPRVTGYWVYGVFTTIFLILSYFSPKATGFEYIAGSIGWYFPAFFLAMILMML